MSKQGFTLIELMVAITIIGILIGGGVSAWQRASSLSRYLNATHEIDALIKEANALAIASRAQKTAQTAAEGKEIDALINPIGINIPISTKNILPDPSQKVTIFQDNNLNNRFDSDDEIINQNIITTPAAIKPADGETINQINIIYSPPRAQTNIYKGDDFINSAPEASFLVTNHFDNYSKATRFKILRSTGVHITSKEL